MAAKRQVSEAGIGWRTGEVADRMKGVIDDRNGAASRALAADLGDVAKVYAEEVIAGIRAQHAEELLEAEARTITALERAASMEMQRDEAQRQVAALRGTLKIIRGQVSEES